MLKIRVKGTGLIPRGLGLAPRLDPFKADYNLVATIVAMPNLMVEFLNPATNKFEPLLRKELRVVWEKYSNYQPTQETKVVEPKPDHKKDETKQHKHEEPKKEIVEEKVAESEPKVEEEVKKEDKEEKPEDKDVEVKKVSKKK